MTRRACFEELSCAPRYVDHTVKKITIHEDYSFKEVRTLKRLKLTDTPSWACQSLTWP